MAKTEPLHSMDDQALNIMRAFGIDTDKAVKAVVIFEVGQSVRVEVTQWVNDYESLEGKKLETMEYDLVPRGAGNTVSIGSGDPGRPDSEQRSVDSR